MGDHNVTTSENDALVSEIEGQVFTNRMDYIRAEKALRDIASSNRYADEQMKALRKRFFDRIQAEAEAINSAKADEDVVHKLAEELADDRLIDEWYDRIAEIFYQENSAGFLLDLLSRKLQGTPLVDTLQKRGVARTGYQERYGVQKIRQAAELVEQKFYGSVERLISFYKERESAISPNFRRLLSTARNKFGDSDYTEFLAEIDELCAYAEQNIDLPALPHHPRRRILGLYIFMRIEELKEADIAEANIPADGFEFEVWCSEQIQRQGWSVTATPKSGDQGVDIIVERNGFVIAVQCKRYASPIGNAAVQEVHAGRTYCGARAAIVIGTGGFTAAARKLAAISKVELLDAAEIGRFSEIFGFTSQVSRPQDRQIMNADTYGQKEIIKTVFFGMAGDGLEFSKELFPAGVESVFRSKFDPESGAGSAEFSGLQVFRILSYASLVFTSKIHLESHVRNHFVGQIDMNQYLINDPEISELMWYQCYDARYMAQIVDSFRAYVEQFGLGHLGFKFLEEFE